MTTRRRVHGAGCAALVLLSGCGSPRDPTKANFTTALDRHYASHCIFLTPSVGLAAFPVALAPGAATDRYDVLVSAGLLSEATSASTHPGPLGLGEVRDAQRIYSLTDAGKALFRSNGTPDASGFCAGHYTVDHIIGFTPPVMRAGQTVSDVSYAVTPHLLGWVANPEVQARYGAELAAAVPTTDRSVLFRTGSGWGVAGDAP